jgi:DNA polymerase-3 subunit gamma/tau
LQQTIEGLAKEYFKVPVKLEVAKVEDEQGAPPSLHEEREMLESERQKKLKESAEKHPMVQSAVEIFGGSIEEIRPIDKGFVE